MESLLLDRSIVSHEKVEPGTQRKPPPATLHLESPKIAPSWNVRGTRDDRVRRGMEGLEFMFQAVEMCSGMTGDLSRPEGVEQGAAHNLFPTTLRHRSWSELDELTVERVHQELVRRIPWMILRGPLLPGKHVG